MLSTTVLAALVATAAAAKDSRTFAVLRHNGNAPLTTCRADPIVSPGSPSAHVHTVMGASNFGLNVTGQSLLQSSCTTSMLKADMSSYWFPTLYFRDPEDGTLEPVPMYYMNVYYFFDATNDDIKPFPLGLQIVGGDAALRTAPATTGNVQLDPSKGPVQPAQITCPRKNYDTPSYPPNSDGSTAGIASSHDQGAGIGFPFQPCDGLYSPLRVDVHMPSCYNPEAGLTDHENNMQFPSDAGNGKLDCPPGWIHVPHMFYETYWNTQAFASRHAGLNGKASPFVFSNGDVTGFSAHADFISGWDEEELQHIIDTCDAGHAGLHACPGLKLGINNDGGSCTIKCPVDEAVDGKLRDLPGNNPLAGWSFGGGDLPDHSPAPAPAPSPSPRPQPGNDEGSNPGPSPSEGDDSSSGSEDGLNERASSAPIPAPTLIRIPEPTPEADKETEAEEDTVTQQAAAADADPTPAPKPHRTSTIYDTVTVWQTATVYAAEDGPAPTDAVNVSGGAAEDIDGYQYVGCYRDSSRRVLSGEKLPKLSDVSNTVCVEYCSSRGFALAGTEYAGECYCGNSLSPLEKLDDGECTMPCKGDETQTCGDHWALSVYAKGGDMPSPAPARARRYHARGHLAHHARHASRRHRR